MVYCLQKMWDNDCPKLLLSMPKIEKALFGLEMRDDMSSRYRDHFIHMFNVYIFGCRILSLILNKYETTKQLDVIRKHFKIEPERDIPFSKPYTAKERLFFLWKIISIYHDVGIPIQHINNIKEGLDIYLHF